MSDIKQGEIAFVSILCPIFQKYIHPKPLVGDLNYMQVKGMFGKTNKGGKSVKILFAEFDDPEHSCNLLWIQKWGRQRCERPGFNVMNKRDLEKNLW